MKPLCIDLFAGLGGWAKGFLAEGYDVVGFDIERHVYGDDRYPAQLVLQDVLTLHGAQFRHAACIVASPPCQAYSYRAMPWNPLWFQNSCMDDDGAPPADHRIPDPIFNDLFWACFRIQREAREAAGRHIPLIVENVKGAQPWVGRAKWHYGSYYLWGDVPALMPLTPKAKIAGQDWNRFRERGEVSPNWRMQGDDATKNDGGSWFSVAHNTESGVGQNPVECTKQGGSGPAWFDTGIANLPSSRNRRKAASAQIAKIPEPLARHIARVFRP